ncbi:MAG: hypothetical protein LCH30_11155 [Proteobacteria bacterium]|nr:hypothetical protein [Pseudomonadota bacterium]
MKRAISLIILGAVLSFTAIAGSYSDEKLSVDTDPLGNRWSIIASLGYTEYQKMYRHDGQTALARLAFAASFLATRQASFGFELGAQTGNRMRLAIPQGTLGLLGCAVRTTVRPMVDLLITANTTPINESLLYTQVKGGIAYRHWQINNILLGDKSTIAGEVQAGIGYPITEITNLNLLYQGIFGGNPKFRANPYGESGYIVNVPIQHGILLGFSIVA